MKIPRISITYDFNSLISPDVKANGWRLNLYSLNKNLNNTFLYSYGVGAGNYRLEDHGAGDSSSMYQIYGILNLTIRVNSVFRPYIGVHPGFSWNAKSGVYLNPTAGLDISFLSIRRGFNEPSIRTFLQARIEYNTLLSSPFLGLGLVIRYDK